MVNFYLPNEIEKIEFISKIRFLNVILMDAILDGPYENIQNRPDIIISYFSTIFHWKWSILFHFASTKMTFKNRIFEIISMF